MAGEEFGHRMACFVRDMAAWHSFGKSNADVRGRTVRPPAGPLASACGIANEIQKHFTREEHAKLNFFRNNTNEPTMLLKTKEGDFALPRCC